MKNFCVVNFSLGKVLINLKWSLVRDIFFLSRDYHLRVRSKSLLFWWGSTIVTWNVIQMDILTETTFTFDLQSNYTRTSPNFVIYVRGLFIWCSPLVTGSTVITFTMDGHLYSPFRYRPRHPMNQERESRKCQGITLDSCWVQSVPLKSFTFRFGGEEKV